MKGLSKVHKRVLDDIRAYRFQYQSMPSVHNLQEYGKYPHRSMVRRALQGLVKYGILESYPISHVRTRLRFTDHEAVVKRDGDAILCDIPKRLTLGRAQKLATALLALADEGIMERYRVVCHEVKLIVEVLLPKTREAIRAQHDANAG